MHEIAVTMVMENIA
jgi:hypothetical protein